MKVLVKSTNIIGEDLSTSKFNLLIEDGIIKRITDTPLEADVTLESDSLYTSIGWVDMNATIGDPGYEYKEDIESIILAAAQGGFTEVVCQPNTNPMVQDKNLIVYYTSRNANRLIHLRPLGAVTQNTEGVELTEMLDMFQAGAVGFSDGLKPLNNPDLILKSLLYLDKIGALFINRPDEATLSSLGVMHEGITSTMLGLKGIPALAEEMGIIRDLKLLEYAGGRLHFSNISCKNSVLLIKEAKQKGLKVSCDIAAHQIAFDDTSLKNFDTNLKVVPPFRTAEDIEALWQGLKNGTIDVIVSSHRPQDEESKKLEFDLAENGIIGLETAFSLINTFNKVLKTQEIVEKLAYKPREILKLPIPRIQEGEIANLTIFDPEVKWNFQEKDIKSKSKNTPFLGMNFKGKPLAIFNNKQHHINEDLLKKINLKSSS